MPIAKFRVTNAGPFDDITFEFDERVNVFVGPNNSGKSTALLALAEATVYPFDFPARFLKGSGSEWEIALTDGQRFKGVLPADIREQPGRAGPLPDIGFSAFVPSLRQSTEYRAKGPSISWAAQSPGPDSSEGSGLNAPELRQRRRLMPTDAVLVSDESVIQKMVDLDYASYRRKQPQIRQLIDTVARVASEITEGYPLEFLSIGEDDLGLFPEFQTIDGSLPLNALSQGTQSIVQWLARFLFGYAEYYDYPEKLEDKPAILIVDEIDAHLHPSWQRRIIPALTGNFRNLQIFCATHSPLMLAGLEEGQAQLLSRDADGEVTVSQNALDIVGWTSDEILRNVLDVRNPSDLYTSSMVERLEELRFKETLTDVEAEELEKLRNLIGPTLLSGPVVAQIEHLSDILKEIKDNTSTATEASRPVEPTKRQNRAKSN